MYRLLLFILPLWFCLVLSLVHCSIWPCLNLNEPFCTFISSWDFDPISFVPSAAGVFARGTKRIPGLVFEGSADNLVSVIEWKHRVCVCVWIISRSISIPLAPDIDRCLQGAASQPHGTLDHVGQIYGLMLPLTTRHPTPITGDISEANRCNLSCLAQSQHIIGSFEFKAYWLHLEFTLQNNDPSVCFVLPYIASTFSISALETSSSQWCFSPFQLKFQSLFNKFLWILEGNKITSKPQDASGKWKAHHRIKLPLPS